VVLGLVVALERDFELDVELDLDFAIEVPSVGRSLSRWALRSQGAEFGKH
jgi:hypothetical protein